MSHPGSFSLVKILFPKTSNTSLLKTTFIHANIFIGFNILFTQESPHLVLERRWGVWNYVSCVASILQHVPNIYLNLSDGLKNL